MRRHGLEKNAVEIVSQALVTDLPSSFSDSPTKYMALCGYYMAQEAVRKVYLLFNLCGVSYLRSNPLVSRLHVSLRFLCAKFRSFLIKFSFTKSKNRFAESGGLAISDVDVVELHDCFSCNELLMYEALGLCKEGSFFPLSHVFIV